MGVLRPLRARHAEPVATEPDDVVGALLRRAGRGDQSAFGELYDELAPMVHGVVLKVVRDPAMSEEVTQEVFVELWRLAARFDGTKGSARSWAATLAHRRAIDRVRSEQASRDRQDRDAQRATTTTHDVVVAEVESTLDVARVRRALAPGIFRRPHLSRGGRAARCGRGHREESYPRWPHSPSRRAGR